MCVTVNGLSASCTVFPSTLICHMSSIKLKIRKYLYCWFLRLKWIYRLVEKKLHEKIYLQACCFDFYRNLFFISSKRPQILSAYKLLTVRRCSSTTAGNVRGCVCTTLINTTINNSVKVKLVYNQS